jgi:hypothetical protein
MNGCPRVNVTRCSYVRSERHPQAGRSPDAEFLTNSGLQGSHVLGCLDDLNNSPSPRVNGPSPVPSGEKYPGRTHDSAQESSPVASMEERRHFPLHRCNSTKRWQANSSRKYHSVNEKGSCHWRSTSQATIHISELYQKITELKSKINTSPES